MASRNAPDPSSPVARAKGAAKPKKAPTAVHGTATLHSHAGEFAKAEQRPKMTNAEQSAEFERVAREHGADGDEEVFKSALRKLARQNGPRGT